LSPRASRSRRDAFSGVLNVNKPTGMTSHDVVRRIRRLAGQRRVGHTGTLDPMATGVLVICLGQATRIAEYVVELPKAYRAVLHLGVATDTCDAEGTVLERHDVEHLDLETIQQLLSRFTGRIDQVPPMYSALKSDGRPLYRLARAGQTVERAPRPVEIYRLELLAWDPPRLEVLVQCSRGTYVRALARDLGEAAGVGAHLASLVRVAVGHFVLEDSVSLPVLEADGIAPHLMRPMEALQHLQSVTVSEEAARRLAHGQTISLEVGRAPRRLAAMDEEGNLLALLRRGEGAGEWHPEKVFRSGG